MNREQEEATGPQFPVDYWASFIGPMRFTASVLAKPLLLKAALGVAFEAVRLFFLPQWACAIFRHRPVHWVDDPLDERLPFMPETARLYLSFIALWMNAVFHIERAYGKRAHSELALYLDYVKKLYQDAGRVYLRAHSTTKRPGRSPNLQNAIIKVLDPHLNCIPSLHVAIVLGAWDRARSVIAGLDGDFQQASGQSWLAALYEHAHSITETTMLMKQHSVNCVGASLWYLSRTAPGLSREFCLHIADSLFTRMGREIKAAPEVRARAREVFIQLDEELALRSDPTGWYEGICHFIESFPKAD